MRWRDVTLSNALVVGYDAATGARRWVADDTAGDDVQVRCTKSEVVVSNGYRIAAISLKSGQRAWSVPLPVNGAVGGGGYGDPSDGLVIGLTDRFNAAGGALDGGVLTYLR